jgi:hypothetical protein
MNSDIRKMVLTLRFMRSRCQKGGDAMVERIMTQRFAGSLFKNWRAGEARNMAKCLMMHRVIARRGG